jgi:hypothetical protein
MGVPLGTITEVLIENTTQLVALDGENQNLIIYNGANAKGQSVSFKTGRTMLHQHTGSDELIEAQAYYSKTPQ